MPWRIILILLLYYTVWAVEIRHWKQISGKERFMFGVFLLAAIYLSIIYIWDNHWPNLNHLMEFLFLKPAESLWKN